MRVLAEEAARLSRMGATEEEIEEISDSAAQKLGGRPGVGKPMLKEGSNQHAIAVAVLVNDLRTK